MKQRQPASSTATSDTPSESVRHHLRRSGGRLALRKSDVERLDDIAGWATWTGAGELESSGSSVTSAYLADIKPVGYSEGSDPAEAAGVEETAPQRADSGDLLATSISKPPIHIHTQYLRDKQKEGSLQPWEQQYLQAAATMQHANFLVLSHGPDNMPLTSKMYPNVVTYDAWGGSDASQAGRRGHRSSGGATIGVADEATLPAEQLRETFENMKTVNFFMADEARLPVYIAAFGSGFFSVLICVCAILYTRYMFSKMRRNREGRRHSKRISTLPLLDKQMVLETHQRENLAELRALNPSLARIEDYIRGEVKKWERRVKQAEESKAAPRDFQQIMNDLQSEGSSDESDNEAPDVAQPRLQAIGAAAAVGAVGAASAGIACRATTHVDFDDLFRGRANFDGTRRDDSSDDESECDSEDEESDAEESGDEESGDESSGSEYTDSDGSYDSETDSGSESD